MTTEASLTEAVTAVIFLAVAKAATTIHSSVYMIRHCYGL